MPKVEARDSVNASKASSVETESGIVTDIAPVVTYSVEMVKSSASTPYALAMTSRSSLISESSIAAVDGLLMSTDTINPTNDGAEDGIDVIGEVLGINVGDEVMKLSQYGDKNF